MKEEAVAIPKPTAPPKAAIRMPVIDGPIMRPACHGMEPSAIAFGRRSRSTSCGISAIRLGSSKARKVLLSAVPEDVEDGPEPVEAVVPLLQGGKRRQPGGGSGSGGGGRQVGSGSHLLQRQDGLAGEAAGHQVLRDLTDLCPRPLQADVGS